MARYGDLNELRLKVRRYLIPGVDIDGTVTIEVAERWFVKLIDEQPTVDVVPREIFEEIREIKKEFVAGDIDDKTLVGRLYQLEKKYTE